MHRTATGLGPRIPEVDPMAPNDTHNRGGLRPATETDAPGGSHETTSAMFRRAAAEGAKQALGAGAQRFAETNPLAAKLLRWGGGMLLFALTGVSTGYFVADERAAPLPAPAPVVEPVRKPQPACDPMTVQHLQHLAKSGGELAKRLRGDGFSQYAELVDQITHVNSLPDDLKLCLLLRNRYMENHQP